MADEFAKVRKAFLEQMSRPTLDRFRDNILEDRIVNDMGWHGNSSRENKARCLIDTMRKEGDEASKMMIAHFQSCDPFLYSDLGLGPLPPAPPDKFAEGRKQFVEQVSRPTLDRFRDNILEDRIVNDRMIAQYHCYDPLFHRELGPTDWRGSRQWGSASRERGSESRQREPGARQPRAGSESRERDSREPAARARSEAARAGSESRKFPVIAAVHKSRAGSESRERGSESRAREPGARQRDSREPAARAGSEAARAGSESRKFPVMAAVPKSVCSPAAEPRSIKEESTTLRPTTEDFWREKQNKKAIYPVTKYNYRNRVALLITNIKFTLEENDRHGAEKDEENAEKLLTDLGYEVVKYTNLTAKAIDEALIKFSKHPKLRETDSVMVVIMSHGELGTILGVENSKSDPDEFSIDNIYKHLGPEKCPALLNKTKILIIQACRGGQKGSVLVSDSAAVPNEIRNQGGSPDSWQRIEHKEKDFISLLSCTPGTKAYRDPKLGSLLIQSIVVVFNTAAYQDDIEELFRKVMQRFEEFCSSNIRQMPTKDRCTLTKRFYFYPGLNVV